MPNRPDEQDLKPVIKASEAVRLIRMGKTDLDLMEKYNISTKGLDSLFRKLVELGAISQDEMEKRKLFFQRVHDIELVDPPQPPVPVVSINTREAVEAIKYGMTDAELIEKFAISARGLESLFKKLVQAGAITETEITLRAFTLQKSHAVELTAAGDPSTMRASISATDAVWAIREGYSDAALMERYGISQKGLDSLFRKLIKMERVSAGELERRTKYFQWADQAYPRLEDSQDARRPEPAAEQGRVSEFAGDYRVYLALAVGCFAGILVLALALYLITGTLPGFAGPPQRSGQSQKSAEHVEKALTALQSQAEQTLGMLEDILPAAGAVEANGRERSVTAASLCQDCLRECERIYPSKDRDSQLSLLNCKGECLAQFRERIKRFKETHYGNPAGNQ